MANYGERTGTNGPGSGVITNDDEFILDIPELVDDSEFDYGKIKDDRSF